MCPFFLRIFIKPANLTIPMAPEKKKGYKKTEKKAEDLKKKKYYASKEKKVC